MSEKLDEWPRVHTCLYSWCPSQRESCKTCDAVAAIIRADKQPPEASFDNVEDMLTYLNGDDSPPS